MKRFDRIKLIQFPDYDSPKDIWAGLPGFSRADAVEEIFRAFGFEILDHLYIITRILYYNKIRNVNNSPPKKYAQI